MNKIEIESMNEEQLFELLDKINEENTDKEIKENTKFDCECGNRDNVIKDQTEGTIVCKKCGVIMANILDDNPEWKFSNDDNYNDYSRCHQINPLLPQSSLSTTIACSSRNKVKMLNNWNAMPYPERTLYVVLKIIQNVCRDNNILKCIEDETKILYKNLSDNRQIDGKKKIIRGRNKKSLIAGCLFASCKKYGQSRSPKEIASMFKLKYKHVTKGYKIVNKLKNSKMKDYEMTVSSSEHFILRYCKNLHIKKEYIEQAVRIAKNIEKLNLNSGHTSSSIATGGILLMANLNNLKITKKNISDQINVSEVTISKTYKKLKKYSKILVNDEIVNKIYNTWINKRDSNEITNFKKINFDKQNAEFSKEITNNYNTLITNILNYYDYSIQQSLRKQEIYNKLYHKYLFSYYYI